MRSLTGAARAAVLAAGLMLAAATGATAASDRHVGYYYPEPQSIEEWVPRSVVLPEADRPYRLAFATALTAELLARPYPPQYAVFAKGADAEKLIIVALSDGTLDTVYRARALLAQMSSVARMSPIFQEFQVEEIFTFLDLLNMLGFSRLTVTNGETFAHQIDIVEELAARE